MRDRVGVGRDLAPSILLTSCRAHYMKEQKPDLWTPHLHNLTGSESPGALVEMHTLIQRLWDGA